MSNFCCCFCLVCPPPWTQGGPTNPTSFSMPLVENNEIWIAFYNFSNQKLQIWLLLWAYLCIFWYVDFVLFWKSGEVTKMTLTPNNTFWKSWLSFLNCLVKYFKFDNHWIPYLPFLVSRVCFVVKMTKNALNSAVKITLWSMQR